MLNQDLLTPMNVEPGGWLQWIDPGLTPRTFTAVQSVATAPTRFLHIGIDTVNRWGSKLGRRLDECNRLPDIFRANGLESIHHDNMSSDNDPSTRRDFSVELVIAFSPLFVRLVCVSVISFSFRLLWELREISNFLYKSCNS